MWSRWGGCDPCQCTQSTWRFTHSKSALAPPTPHCIWGLTGADRSWERSATEAARILHGSTVISILVATVPQPPVPAPACSTPQPCTRSGMNTTEKWMWPWAASEHDHRGLSTTQAAQVHCDHSALTYTGNHLLWGRACTQGQWGLIKPEHQIFIPKMGEQTPPLTGWWQPQSRGESLPHTVHQPHPLSRDQWPAHSEEGHGSIHKETSPCTKKPGSAQCKHEFSHEKITVSPTFKKTEKAKKKWKGRGITLN